GIQCLGVVSVIAWGAVTITITFFIIKKTIGLRVTEEEELSGLDLPEHGLVNAYADFQPIFAHMSAPSVLGSANSSDVPVVDIDEAVPVQIKTPKTTVASDVKMTKIEIFVRQERFEALKEAMLEIGITGMTVTNVLGCGVQKGKPEYYRGAVQEITLHPRVQVEIVVSKIPVKTVVNTAKKVMYTGHTGDGKIFVYDVENVIKVRTGEEGTDALQDEEQY
ncbi:MAG: adenylate cyclase, partial [Lachnospiraceae bacterium]|nr:adenylate cyclase [Lachnospiraceae bacterium]